MPILREQVTTALPIDDTFAFLADFANAQDWDPGVAASERIDDGPVRVGSRFRLQVRMGRGVAPMEYRISRLEAPHRVVLEGTGNGVVATDDITFEPADGGTRIHYTADIRLTGLRRLLTPLAGGAFRAIAANARAGMDRALRARAAARSADGVPAGGPTPEVVA
jgi:carbon monoxide dehydrogenase subunit G